MVVLLVLLAQLVLLVQLEPKDLRELVTLEQLAPSY
jgi:hypothetical protein